MTNLNDSSHGMTVLLLQEGNNFEMNLKNEEEPIVEERVLT